MGFDLHVLLLFISDKLGGQPIQYKS